MKKSAAKASTCLKVSRNPADVTWEMTKPIGSAGSDIAVQFARLDRSAARVARQAPDTDYVQEVVEGIKVKHAVAADAAVIKTKDQMIGTLIDIFA